MQACIKSVFVTHRHYCRFVHNFIKADVTCCLISLHPVPEIFLKMRGRAILSPMVTANVTHVTRLFKENRRTSVLVTTYLNRFAKVTVCYVYYYAFLRLCLCVCLCLLISRSVSFTFIVRMILKSKLIVTINAELHNGHDCFTKPCCTKAGSQIALAILQDSISSQELSLALLYLVEFQLG